MYSNASSRSLSKKIEQHTKKLNQIRNTFNRLDGWGSIEKLNGVIDEIYFKQKQSLILEGQYNTLTDENKRFIYNNLNKFKDSLILILEIMINDIFKYESIIYPRSVLSSTGATGRVKVENDVVSDEMMDQDESDTAEVNGGSDRFKYSEQEQSNESYRHDKMDSKPEKIDDPVNEIMPVVIEPKYFKDEFIKKENEFSSKYYHYFRNRPDNYDKSEELKYKYKPRNQVVIEVEEDAVVSDSFIEADTYHENGENGENEKDSHTNITSTLRVRFTDKVKKHSFLSDSPENKGMMEIDRVAEHKHSNCKVSCSQAESSLKGKLQSKLVKLKEKNEGKHHAGCKRTAEVYKAPKQEAKSNLLEENVKKLDSNSSFVNKLKYSFHDKLYSMLTTKNLDRLVHKNDVLKDRVKADHIGNARRTMTPRMQRNDLKGSKNKNKYINY